MKIRHHLSQLAIDLRDQPASTWMLAWSLIWDSKQRKRRFAARQGQRIFNDLERKSRFKAYPFQTFVAIDTGTGKWAQGDCRLMAMHNLEQSCSWVGPIWTHEIARAAAHVA